MTETQIIIQLLDRIDLLEKQVAILEEKLSRYEHPKNSSNSSIAPSQDLFRGKRTSSLREKSGKKPGGQPGHKGTTLRFSDTPDRIIEHKSDFCSVCGGDLTSIESVFAGSRQVIDLPPTVPVISEHRIFSRRCSCGHCQTGSYPAEAHSRVCYGQNLLGLTAYFHSRQYIPYDRMREMYREVFGLEISCGSLVEMIRRVADKAGDIYEDIRRRISQSPVVGGDETGVCIDGKNRWAWTFQTPRYTFIDVDVSRGKKVIDKHFQDGFPKSVMVHDCWKPYFKVYAENHQICTAHLLRELKYLDQVYGNEWTTQFTQLLKEALLLKKALTPIDYLSPIEKRKQLEKRLDELLKCSINEKHGKLLTFQHRMKEYRQYLFQFLYSFEIPPDNNASERAVRTFKVKQKVSGLFRSLEGAHAFSVIRSLIDTVIKNGQNVRDGLALVAAAETEQLLIFYLKKLHRILK